MSRPEGLGARVKADASPTRPYPRQLVRHAVPSLPETLKQKGRPSWPALGVGEDSTWCCPYLESVQGSVLVSAPRKPTLTPLALRKLPAFWLRTKTIT